DHGDGIKTFSLLPYSPAIGTGDVNALGPGPYDGRGFPRVVNGKVDIGAFEHQPYVVTNLNDSGPGSLRALITGDDDGSPIVFAPNLTAGTIKLTSGPIEIVSSLTINGPGANFLTVDGNGTGRVFTVDSWVSAAISGLTIAGGKATQGGGVFNA